MYRLVRRNE